MKRHEASAHRGGSPKEQSRDRKGAGRRDGGTKWNPQSPIRNPQSPIRNPQSPIRNPQSPTGARIDALLILLERLEQLHQQLHETLRRKLDLMRRADIDELRVCVDAEQALVTRISEQEGLRKQLMEQIGRACGMSADVARKLPARRLADRLPQPGKSRLQALAGRLRVAVERVKKVNDLVNRVTSEVLTHMAAVFSAVVATDAPASGYTDRGRTVQSRCQELFEAIG
ncbi:MAG: flagellar export chaperone FlgN [Phycisphaerae bacterium]